MTLDRRRLLEEIGCLLNQVGQPPRNARISMTVTFCCTGLADSGAMPPIKCWEIVADKLSAAGWSWGYCSAVTRDGWRWIVDAHREGRRYIVHSDELLSAFLELEQTLL